MRPMLIALAMLVSFILGVHSAKAEAETYPDSDCLVSVCTGTEDSPCEMTTLINVCVTNDAPMGQGDSEELESFLKELDNESI